MSSDKEISDKILEFLYNNYTVLKPVKLNDIIKAEGSDRSLFQIRKILANYLMSECKYINRHQSFIDIKENDKRSLDDFEILALINQNGINYIENKLKEATKPKTPAQVISELKKELSIIDTNGFDFWHSKSLSILKDYLGENHDLVLKFSGWLIFFNCPPMYSANESRTIPTEETVAKHRQQGQVLLDQILSYINMNGIKSTDNNSKPSIVVNGDVGNLFQGEINNSSLQMDNNTKPKETTFSKIIEVLSKWWWLVIVPILVGLFVLYADHQGWI